MSQLILLNKPFNVLSQFRGEARDQTLSHYVSHKGFYPAGRLDKDSEGLLLLTDNGSLQHRITNPRFKLAKTYLVQVEGEIDDSALTILRHGVKLRDGVTRPALAQAVDEPPLWPRDPPIRVRKNIPTSWLELIITEGRNRQVRRMTAAVGYPTLRLVRWRIGPWELGNLPSGQLTIVSADGLDIAT